VAPPSSVPAGSLGPEGGSLAAFEYNDAEAKFTDLCIRELTKKLAALDGSKKRK